MADDRGVDPIKLRQDLLKLADAIIRLDEEGTLLEATPELIKLFGDMRSHLFEYEVRFTDQFFPDEDGEVPEVVEAQRIVNDFARQMEEEDRQWWRRWSTEVEGEDEFG